MSTEKPLSGINFFICSTYVDLRAHREAVIKNIRSRAGVINAQEFFGARDRKPLETCLEEVDKSHVFLMFLGPRYGSVDAETGRSFVEREFERAKARGIPRFAYLIDSSHPFPIHHVSLGDDADRLRRFKESVQAELTVDYFTTPDDLAEKVYADLVRELPKHGFKLGEEQAEGSEIPCAMLLRQFLALPKLFHGRTLRMRGRLGDYRRADTGECQAFSYRLGAAVARRFGPSDQETSHIVCTSLSEIFASEQEALALIAAPSDVDIVIEAKTIQGEYSSESPIYGNELEFGSSFVVPTRRVPIGYRAENHLILGLEFVRLETEQIPTTVLPTPAAVSS